MENLSSRIFYNSEAGRYNIQVIEPLILTIRGQKVILDAELARIYGVTTKVFNQAVKRNKQKFPNNWRK
jgi:hypothetical protein